MNNKFKCNKNIRIRPATVGDKEQLSRLFHQTRNFIYEYLDAEYDYKKMLVEQQESFRESGYGRQFPNAMEFVIEQNDSFIGRITLDFGNDIIHLIDIALIKEARGKGFGEEALRGIQAAATSAGAALVLNLAIDNISAYYLYKKLGFIVESRGDIHQRMVWYPTYTNQQVSI